MMGPQSYPSSTSVLKYPFRRAETTMSPVVAADPPPLAFKGHNTLAAYFAPVHELVEARQPSLRLGPIEQASGWRDETYDFFGNPGVYWRLTVRLIMMPGSVPHFTFFGLDDLAESELASLYIRDRWLSACKKSDLDCAMSILEKFLIRMLKRSSS